MCRKFAQPSGVSIRSSRPSVRPAQIPTLVAGIPLRVRGQCQPKGFPGLKRPFRLKIWISRTGKSSTTGLRSWRRLPERRFPISLHGLSAHQMTRDNSTRTLGKIAKSLRDGSRIRRCNRHDPASRLLCEYTVFWPRFVEIYCENGCFEEFLLLVIYNSIDA